MDDATSAVDPEVEARILGAMSRTAEDMTAVLIAYRKATIRMADEVLFLEHGRIVDRGRHDDLIASNPAYARLVNAYEVARTEVEYLDQTTGAADRGSR